MPAIMRLLGLGLALALPCLLGCTEADVADGLREQPGSARLGLASCLTLSGAAAVQDAAIAFNPADPTRAVANFGSTSTLAIGSVGLAQLAALVRFDLGAIPPGATLNSASLGLLQGTQVGGGTASVHNVLAPWQGPTVTWTTFADAFDPVPVATFLPSSVESPGPLAVDLTSSAQLWLAGDLPNYGVYLREPAGGRAVFGSTDASNPAFHPTLTVCYCTPGNEVCNGIDDDCDGVIDEGASCDDGDPCTADACDTTCVHVAIPEGVAVSDGDACNGLEVCQGAQLVVTPPACADGYACTTDSCDSVSGCQHTGGPATDPWLVPETSTAPLGSLVRDIEVDAVGNTYTLGRFQGTLGLGVGVWLASDFDIYGGSTFECFVMKRDPSGALLWAVTLPDEFGNGEPGGLTIHGGEVYATYRRTMETYINPQTVAYMSKLSAIDGAEVWNVVLGVSGYIDVGDVALTSVGTVVTELVSTVVDVVLEGPPVGEVLALDSATGAVVWDSVITGDFFSLSALAIDALDNIFIMGGFGGLLNLGGSTYTSLGNNAGDAFVAKLSSVGAPQWALTMGSLGYDQSAGGLAVDGGGGTFLSFTAKGPLAVGSGPVLPAIGDTDVVLARLDASGNQLWSKRLGGPHADSAGRILVDGSGKLVATGSYQDGADLGGGLLATDTTTGFLTRYDASGNYLDQRDMHYLLATGLGADCAGNIYGCGTWTGQGTLGTPPTAAKVLAVFRLDHTIAPKGPGYCLAQSYCDSAGCLAASAKESLLFCACGLLDPACGVGSCGGGAYCDGNGCASPQCFDANSFAAQVLCSAGVDPNTCLGGS